MRSFGGREERFAGERTANEIDEGGRELRDVAEGFMLDLMAEAERAMEEAGLVDTAFALTRCCGSMNSARFRWHAFEQRKIWNAVRRRMT